MSVTTGCIRIRPPIRISPITAGSGCRGNARAATASHANVRAELEQRLFTWFRARRTRVTIADAEVERRIGSAKQRGYRCGEW